MISDSLLSSPAAMLQPPTPTLIARYSTRPLSIQQQIVASAAAAGKRKLRAKKAAKKIMMTMMMPTAPPPATTPAPFSHPNINQYLVNILELVKAHYTSDGITKGLKKGLYTMENSGACPCGKHSSAALHHFTARGNIDMQLELRGDDIWGYEEAFGLDTGFFKKHNKNKSKKRKASAIEKDNNDANAANIATNCSASLP